MIKISHNYQALCDLASEHRLWVLIWVTGCTYGIAGEERRDPELLCVTPCGDDTRPIAFARIDGNLDQAADNVLSILRRALRETA